MGLRDRSRRAQLQALLGELGTVEPYVSRANGTAPTAGWYIQLNGGLEHVAKAMWCTRAGLLFAGLDTTHAAVAIEKVRELAEP